MTIFSSCLAGTEWVYSSEQHIRHPCRKMEREKWNGKKWHCSSNQKGPDSTSKPSAPAGLTIWSRWASVRAGAVSALRQEAAVNIHVYLLALVSSSFSPRSFPSSTFHAKRAISRPTRGWFVKTVAAVGSLS
jgi:hypothetical protein